MSTAKWQNIAGSKKIFTEGEFISFLSGGFTIDIIDNISKSTGRKPGKSHLCALIKGFKDYKFLFFKVIFKNVKD